MPKGEDLHFETNELFLEMEKSKRYKAQEKLVRKALRDQWQDIVLSGIVNALYNEYKNYFKRPQNKRVKVRKAETVGSKKELEQVEDEELAGDKILVPEEALMLTPLLLFLRNRVNSDIKPISSYYSFRPKTQAYLKAIANQAGQTVIDQIPSPRPLAFRLSKAEYTKKIKERVNTLIKGLDETTKKRLVRELARGIELGETKNQMVSRLQRLGSSISKSRAKVIVATETQAITEYIRYETARLNGIKFKTWITAMDERVCPVCGPLHGQETGIKDNFKSEGFSYPYPPAHINCRCWAEYTVNIGSEAQYIYPPRKEKSLMESIGESIRKAKDDYKYKRGTEGVEFTITNPNAIWAGGESLVGPDKSVGNYYFILRDIDGAKDRIRTLLGLNDEGIMRLDSQLFMPIYEVDNILLSARKDLSDTGFIQLLLRLGIKKKIMPKSTK